MAPICLICLFFYFAFFFSFCSDMDLTPFVVFSQLYEVALNAQNTERVKLVTFDGYLGYQHNGLYRDPKLPGILKWAYLFKSIQNILFAATQHVFWKISFFKFPLWYHLSFAGTLYILCSFGKLDEERRKKDWCAYYRKV